MQWLFTTSLMGGDDTVETSPDLLQLLELSVLFQDRLDNPLAYLTCNVEAIRARQEVFLDLLEHPELLERLRVLYQSWQTALELRTMGDSSPLQLLQSLQLVEDFQEQMAALVATVRKADDLHSPGFARVAAALDEFVRGSFVPGSINAWNSLTKGLAVPQSVTYRVQLNEDLQIIRSALVRVDDTPYKLKSRFYSLMHWSDPGDREFKSQTFLEKRASVNDDRPGAIELYSLSGKEDNTLLLADERNDIRRNIFSLLSQATEQLMQSQLDSALSKLKAFMKQVCAVFQGLVDELRFVLGCMNVIQDLRAGLYPVCFPEVHPMEDGIQKAQGVFHPMLAFQEQVTRNLYQPDDWGELLLVSGINTGGKTTYLQAVGSLYLLMQLGLPVPAEQAVLSVVPSIAAVFATDEAGGSFGRLEQELAALQAALILTKSGGVILFNEPLTGASHAVCTQLTLELLAAAKAMGCRGLWVSHLYDVVACYEVMNRRIGGSRLGSVYVTLKNGVPDYTVHVGLPEQNAYAVELFQKGKAGIVKSEL